jgi:nicotinamidase-related amidase
MIALIIIDMQRWMFRYPDRLAQADSLLCSVRRMTEAFEAKGQPIYDVVTIHHADRSTWSRLMLKYDHPCLINGTSDVEALDGYVAPKAARRVAKTQNSAFFKTDLEAYLRAEGVDTLMLAGVFVDRCVGLTAADAAQHRFEVVCVEDAIGHVDGELLYPIFAWLQQMYEIKRMRTGYAVERLASLPDSFEIHG